MKPAPTITAYGVLLLAYVALCFLIDSAYDLIYGRFMRRLHGTAGVRGANMIRITDLTKTYGSLRALDGVSLAIEKGRL